MKQKLYLMLAGLFLLSVQLKAQSPNALNYQGVARDISGNTLVNQIISIRFTIHMGSASGNSVYQETQLTTTNQFGLFTLSLGGGSVVSGNLSNIAWGKTAYFLQVEMDATGGSNYTTMGTMQFLSVPYSLYADSGAYATNATHAISSDTAAFAKNAAATPSPWTISGTAIYNNNTGVVGIGTASPGNDASLTVASSHVLGAVVTDDSLSSNSLALGGAYAGTGKFDAVGVGGYSAPADGYGYGGQFVGGYIGSESYATGATAANSYYGTYNYATSTKASKTYGSYNNATASSGTPTGIVGTATDNGSGTAYGVYGSASSTTGIGYGIYGTGNTGGVYGIGTGNGVLFSELGSPYGSGTDTRVVGVVGEVTGAAANASNYENDGVLGVVTATGNYHTAGLCGYGTNATGSDIGVFGMAQGLGTENYVLAVYGYEDPAQGGLGVASYVADYAGYFIGDVDVTGNFNVSGTKNFRIDDPMDPANKYLYHSCIESPDMMNIYNGNTTTDANGDATITLPSYFQTENIDYKYQLTVIGQFAQAMVATKIANNQFTIKTDKPNVEVSWQVTGVRNDPGAQQNRLPAEVEKKGIEKGHYIHPEYYGQPQSLSIANLISGSNPNMQNLATLKSNTQVATPQAPARTTSTATKILK